MGELISWLAKWVDKLVGWLHGRTSWLAGMLAEDPLTLLLVCRDLAFKCPAQHSQDSILGIPLDRMLLGGAARKPLAAISESAGRPSALMSIARAKVMHCVPRNTIAINVFSSCHNSLLGVCKVLFTLCIWPA